MGEQGKIQMGNDREKLIVMPLQPARDQDLDGTDVRIPILPIILQAGDCIKMNPMGMSGTHF